MKFQGTADYVATDDLTIAVNAAVTLERPLLVKGEPGTGKTELAMQVSAALGLRMIEWNIKSTTRAQQGLYEYDAVSRLRDSQLGEERVHDVKNYIRKGKLWEAFEAGEKVVLLIDEIFSSTKRARRSARKTVPSSSSPPTTKKNCPTPFCAVAFSTTSSFPTWTPCARSSRCTTPASRKAC